MTKIMLRNFLSLYLKAFIQNLVQNGPVVSEKIRFEFLYVHELGPRSSNDLDLGPRLCKYKNSNRILNPQFYIPSFVKIGPPVLEKIF